MSRQIRIFARSRSARSCLGNGAETDPKVVFFFFAARFLALPTVQPVSKQ